MMANFKGGFAFNNGPAKVEVEQAADGTLISCVNPVTGESLGGGGGGVETARLTISASAGAGTMYGPFVISGPDPIGTTIVPIAQIRSGEYELVLYNGSCMVVFDTTYTISVSGDVTQIDSEMYIISGDCSISLDDEPIT